MNGLLVRVGADQGTWGGKWNGPIDSHTQKFVYVPIPETGACHPGMAKPYSLLMPYLSGKWPSLPAHLAGTDMHLDPDFDYLTYGDQGRRANQIKNLKAGDILVFYAGFKDIHPNPRLVYAIIGLLVIDQTVPVGSVPPADFHKNAHTRRLLPFASNDIVVYGQPTASGRLERAIPIGHYHSDAYRVLPNLLTAWGSLGVTGGYIQRSGHLPVITNASLFHRWLLAHRISLLHRNN